MRIPKKLDSPAIVRELLIMRKNPIVTNRPNWLIVTDIMQLFYDYCLQNIIIKL